MRPDPRAFPVLGERVPRIDSLTGMRWWAAFVVFGYHMLVFAPLPPIAAAFLEQGFYGVTFFFVLSGFVLTWSASDRVSQSTFYWRRFARVYPAHVVALLLAIPVFYSFAPDPAQTWVKPVDVGILLLSFVLLQGWSRDPVILFSGNPAAWTLTCEAFFYALHPYLNRLLTPLRSRGAVRVAVGVLALAFAYRLVVQLVPGWSGSVPLPVERVTEFALGMALAWAVRCGWRPRVPVTAALATLAAVMGVVVVLPRIAPGSLPAILVQGFANELVIVGCGLVVLALAVRSVAGGRSVLAHPIMVKLGEWSFAFYLVHATIIYATLAFLGPRPEGWGNLLWYLALLLVSLVASAALHELVERPVEKRLRDWKDRRAARPA